MRPVARLILVLMLVCPIAAHATEVRRTMRLAGWTLVGAGALSFAGAGLARTGHAASFTALPSTWLMASGLVATGSGLGLLWRGSASSRLPDIARVRPPGLDLVAGLDPKRGSDLGVRVPLWRMSF